MGELPSPWEGPVLAPFEVAPEPGLAGPGVGSAALRFPPLAPADPGPVLPDTPLPAWLESAVPKRRCEFVAGRLAAREALRRAGAAGDAWLAAGEDRAPVWPEGTVGSLTHTRGMAWALAAPAGVRRGIGCDLEAVVAARSVPAVTRLVLREEERDAGPADLGFHEYLTLVFGAKECLFKCLYPTVRRYFGFEAARVDGIDVAGGRFTIHLLEDLHPELGPGRSWEGRFAVVDLGGDEPRPGIASAVEW